VAVLDEDGGVRKTQESPPGITELGSSNQHRTVDVMTLLGIRIDGRSAIDKGVEERKWAGQLEPFCAELQDQEWSVAGGFNVDGDELGIFQPGLWSELGSVDRDLLPRNRLRSPTWLEQDGLQCCRLSAVRRNWISSRVIALRRMTAAA
jgi:hypothetical protein